MKAKSGKPIRENRKVRWVYGAGATAAMLISLGGIILAKTSHGGTGLFPDSLQSLSLPGIVGWLVGILGAMTAVAVAKKSKGVFILTSEKAALKGDTDKNCWSISRNLIVDFHKIDSWYGNFINISMILLTVKNPEGGVKTFQVGPFSRKTVEIWMNDLKVISRETMEARARIKRSADHGGQILKPANKVI